MGLAYERGAVLDASVRDPAVPIGLAPLNATVIAVAFTGEPALILDKSALLVIPARKEYQLQSRCAIASIATLFLHPAICSQAITEYGDELDFARYEELFADVSILVRSVWIDELIHRYVFERSHCDKHASLAARFAELELTKELYFSCSTRAVRAMGTLSAPEQSPIVQRALVYLERHLFASVELDVVARHAGASPSTLLRAFKRDLGVTPSAYVLGRRLDEAMLLLKSRRYGVSEVAQIVGYSTVASFSHAFSRHFGSLPSAVLTGRPSA